ncbi:MAG: lipid-A-disaccharide synthase [alpha proteobacterium MED-G09]|nr:MAG: lipid-A-disaccharide synthase [alpha proteobacterium MED-G09]
MKVKKEKAIYLVAGEPSGDFIGSEVISELLKLYPNMSIHGVGGHFMEKFNFKSLFPMNELSIMGIIPVLLKIVPLYRRINQVVEDILFKNPDIVILIDSPDFNHRVAKKLRKKLFKSPIICYVAPTVWAWRQKRVKSMARDFNHLLSILPFEGKFFNDNGLNTTYVGHPVIPKININSEETFRSKYKVNDDPVLIFLPGSRDSEIKRNIKPFKIAFIEIQKQIPNIKLVIPVNKKKKPLIDKYFDNAIFISDESDKFLLFKEADVACATSGTVTLELGLALTPMVVIYKLDFITWSIVSRLAKVKFVSLVNLVLNKPSVEELLQSRCSPKNISKSVLEILKKDKIYLNQKKDLQKFKGLIENNYMSPSKKAAETIYNILGN